MSKEQPPPPQGFSFSEPERFLDRVSHTRFLAMLQDEGTTIHEVSLSTNNYGEFLFVTASRASSAERQCLTFWGMGYHERRERYLAEEWFWYDAYQFRDRMEHIIDKQEAIQQIEERRNEILPYAGPETQSRRGALFEILADLTDEDGATIEMDDVGEAFLDFDDAEE